MSLMECINAGEFKSKLPWVPKHKDAAVHAAYVVESKRLDIKFQAACVTEWGDPSWPDELIHMVFDAAWEQGHASGYSEVACAYQTLAAIARTAFHFGFTKGGLLAGHT